MKKSSKKKNAGPKGPAVEPRPVKLREHTSFKSSETGEKKHGVPVWVKESTLDYERQLHDLQIELMKMQSQVRADGMRLVLLFEGRDAAGKGGTIKRFTEHMNPRGARVVALEKPSNKERTQWYFQRYVAHLPAAGEIVLLDRSWYNRAGVEHVMGFCTDDEYWDFLRSCPRFEEILIHSGIILIKYWFSVSDEEQENRFRERIEDPLKRWKFSPMDLESRSKWIEYSKAKDEMFSYTDTKTAPWFVVNADDKRRARLNTIHHLLSRIPYQEIKHKKINLPPMSMEGYVRPPLSDQTFIPEIY